MALLLPPSLDPSRRVSQRDAATSIIEGISTSADFFVDVMMMEELQMSPPMAMSATEAGETAIHLPPTPSTTVTITRLCMLRPFTQVRAIP